MIGLALAATIAAAHGTRLVLNANPHGGLTAAITFPVEIGIELEA